MRIIGTVLAVALLAGTVFAGDAMLTGNDYLKLSNRQKAKMVQSYVTDAKAKGVTIRNKATAYCRELDAFYAKNPKLKKEPFANVLKTLVIMQYDWDQKGVDKEKLANEWLGVDLYQKNRARAKGK